jgi:predicted ribosome quality control (RQC) complex YloA/Tae2 family protein
MTEIELDITKSIEENASVYFEKAKKLKHKLERTEKAIERLKKKKEAAEKKQARRKRKQEEKRKPKREKDWYEKFHWFYSSEGFLVIGGRGATTNEIVIKKHTDKDDLVFHTDASGSPFFVVKSKGKEIGEKTIRETAIATASYSKAWKKGLMSLEVFYVSPEQVTKEAKAGEYLTKGSFMIYGKKQYLKPMIGMALGIYQEKVMCAPVSAIKEHCKEYVEIEPGKEKKSDTAKKAKRVLKEGHLDDYIAVIPTGGCHIKKKR